MTGLPNNGLHQRSTQTAVGPRRSIQCSTGECWSRNSIRAVKP